MTVLVTLGVLVGVLCVLNLLLTFGVIRRLREHGDLIAKGAASGAGGGPPTLPVGQRAAEFTGITTDGAAVSRDLLSGDTLVAFLTPGCTPCQKKLPGLVEAAREWPGGRSKTLAVVIGDPDEAADYVEKLVPVARVVLESPGGEVAAAFGVQSYPLFGVVDRSGKVLRSVLEPGELRLQAA